EPFLEEKVLRTPKDFYTLRGRNIWFYPLIYFSTAPEMAACGHFYKWVQGRWSLADSKGGALAGPGSARRV
ncbi:MAG: hypothetical protein ACOX88_06630, partial [Christensenellales bacterium]